MNDKKRVIVGMSGGVDSSVAALLLKRQGYEVIGLFMKNWNETSPDDVCSAEADYADVRRVCSAIDIPYYTVNLSKAYWDKVFVDFIEEYKKGRTPNPDVLCNREIKFGSFLDYAKKMDADFLATGHYCGIRHTSGRTYLYRAKDENKDQTYFLNQVKEEQLRDVLFPLEKLTKTEVREIAKENNLVTTAKKDSTGVCFIGERDFRGFLSNYLPAQKGKIMTLDGRIVGEHNGVCFYTVGQRKGFGVGGINTESNDSPWYIIKRDIENNILYVHQGEHPLLFSNSLIAEEFSFISDRLRCSPQRVLARIRHRQPLQAATASYIDDNTLRIDFDLPQRAVASGQYCVLYDGEICLGGGVIR